jgi:tripartite-type tricarboxylate transporter receptor subunit TctC
MLAPAALSEPIAAVLEREVSAAMRLPDVAERLRTMDTTPEVMVGGGVRVRLKADREAWAKVVAAAGMRVD